MSDRAALAPRSFALERSLLDCEVSAGTMDGAARVSFPIDLTPGRDGFGPGLSMVYSGSRSNAPYGVGWSLAGVDSVSRDMGWRLPTYLDDQDRFLLGGLEIVPVRTVGGAIQSSVQSGYKVERWRARIDRQRERIEKWTDQASGRVHWRKHARDGTVSIYGERSDNSGRIFDPREPTRVAEWYLERRHGPKGDVIFYEYKPEDIGGVDTTAPQEQARLDPALQAMRYLKRIRYGASAPWRATDAMPANLTWLFEVVLDYGEHVSVGGLPDPAESQVWAAREDTYSSFRRGFEVRVRQTTALLCR